MSAPSLETSPNPRLQQPGVRPVIYDYQDVTLYLRAMLAWHKSFDATYSVRRETAKLRRCSPALVTQIIQGRRRLTLDRIDDFSHLLQLSGEEKSYLTQWLSLNSGTTTPTDKAPNKRPPRVRSANQNHLLKDWVNVYVKDAVRLKDFKPDPATIFRLLGGIVPLKRIEKSFTYLLQQGFLRRTLDGRIVENDLLVTTTDEIPNKHIRAFHQNALSVAKRGLSLFPLAKRRESALILPLNESSLQELKMLLKEFYERLLLFAETHASDDEQLYQVIINLSPIGGSSHATKN